jgi:PAS domain S-box-containing protein
MLIHGADEARPASEDAPPPPASPPPDAADPAGPAKPASPAETASRAAWVPGAITTVGGLLCAAVGVAVMVAWYARATAFLRFGSQNPMSFNTAVAFTVTGIALVALPRWPRAVLVAGVFDTVLGVAILAEYALDRSFGIDELFARAYIVGPHDVPGRSAVNTLACLVLTGAALLVWGPWRARRRPAVLAAAGSLIGAVAAAAAFGYATGSPSAYGWTYVTAMAFITSLTMLVLAISLLSAAWGDSLAGHAGLPRWLPMAAGALTLGLALWLAIDGRAVAAGRISSSTFVAATVALGLLMAVLVALSVWLAQQADRRRQLAVAETVRRSEAESAARASEKRLFQFLGAMPVAVFVTLPDGRPYYANSEAERVLGRGASADIGPGEISETYNVLLAGTDERYPEERIPTNLAGRGQTSHIDDMEIRRPDGAKIPVEVWGQPVYGRGGGIDYAIAAFADISERQARERVIARQAALLDLAHDAIFVRDIAGRITYWNTGAEHAYGFTRAQALGQVSNDLLRTHFPEPLADIEATTARQNRWDGELSHRRADGQTIIVESRWAAQRGPGGSLLGFMEINRDITARKDAEREMSAAADDIRALNFALEERVRERTVHLARANKNLAAFTYSAAHDLRTPLRAVGGFAEVLVEDYGDRLEVTGRGYAERIQEATLQMAARLDDLLHLSQVSRAGMNLQDIDLSAGVTAICDQLRARDPGRRVQVTIQRGVRATADRPLIRTALEELLGNAWKFTAGREQATIEFAATAVDGAPLCCSVSDNGAGFDPAYVGKLFQPFQRLHDTSEFAGSGIGLASVQRIIDRHGGRTWAEGAVGGGATIYFTLDAKNAS